MRKILIIAFKEFKSYFKTPMAFVSLVIMTSIFNYFFYVIVDNNQEAVLRDVFKVMEFMFIFFVPILAMKLFAEEKQTGTMEFLMTAPVTNTIIVFGKYFGAIAFVSLPILLSMLYLVILNVFAAPDNAAALVGYAGLWLEVCFFLAIGMYCSSLTRNQILAALLTYVILFVLYFTISGVVYVDGVGEQILRQFSLLTHSENFILGVISLHDIVYFVTGILFCLVATRISIEHRLWQ